MNYIWLFYTNDPINPENSNWNYSAYAKQEDAITRALAEIELQANRNGLNEEKLPS